MTCRLLRFHHRDRRWIQRSVRRTPYQKGTDDPWREAAGVPDVAYNAAVLHGVLTYLRHSRRTGWLLYSSAAPAPVLRSWAAITAIANQKAGEAAGIPQLGHLPDRQGRTRRIRRRFTTSPSGTNSAVEFDSSAIR